MTHPIHDDIRGKNGYIYKYIYTFLIFICTTKNLGRGGKFSDIESTENVFVFTSLQKQKVPAEV